MARRAALVLLTVALAGCGASNAKRSLTVDDQEPLRAVTAPSATGKCGVERWAVKTLTDPAAPTVTLTPVKTNIPHLVGLANSGPETRQAPTETTLFQLTGTHLVEFKLEGDSDIHLVLRSVLAGNPTMIAEIPDPACAAGSRVLGQITATRAAFLSYVASKGLTLSSSFQAVDWPVTLQGVGFFDFPHGQTGLAANDIELHPVIYFHPSQ
jgi:hypothetical protein